MRLAWFRSGAASAAHRDEDTSTLVAELGATHHLDVFDAARAHDFPWRHDRDPYDRVVYELAGDAPFIDAYAVHYPGIVLLRTAACDPRLFGSPLPVVHDAAIAQRVRDEYPSARVRVVASGVTVDGARPSTGPQR